MIKEYVLGYSSGKKIILLSKLRYLNRVFGDITLYYPESYDSLFSNDAELLKVNEHESCIRRVQDLALTGVFVLHEGHAWYAFSPILDTSVSYYENSLEIILSDSGLEIAKRERISLSTKALSTYLIMGLPFEPFQNLSFWDEIRKVGPFSILLISDGKLLLQTETIRTKPNADTSATVSTLRETLIRSLNELKDKYKTFSSDLSGGVDSACIVYLMRRIAERLVLFHAESDERENSDTKWAGHIAIDTQIKLYKLPSVGKNGKRFAVDEAYLYGNVPDAPLLWGDTEGYVSEMLSLLKGNNSHVHLIGIGGDELFTPMEATPWSIVRQENMIGSLIYAIKYGLLMRRPFFSCIKDLCDDTTLQKELSTSIRNGFAQMGDANPRQMTWSENVIIPTWMTQEARSAAQKHTEQLLKARFPDFDSDRSRFQALQSLVFQKKIFAQIVQTAGDEINWYAPFLNPMLIRVALTLPSKTSISNVRTKPMLYETLKGLVPSEVFTRGEKGDYSGALYDGYRVAAATYRGKIQDFELAKMGIVDASLLNGDLSMPTARFERIDFFMRFCNLERWVRQVALYMK